MITVPTNGTFKVSCFMGCGVGLDKKSREGMRICGP